MVRKTIWLRWRSWNLKNTEKPAKIAFASHGKIFTFLDLVRQHVLTSEFASEQLGMTVAEFEALL